MYRILVAAILAGATMGAAHAASQADALKTYVDTLSAQAMQATGDEAALPTGLAPDAGFSPGGARAFFPAASVGWSAVEDGLRIEPWVENVTLPTFPPITLPQHAGYYLLGRQQNTDGTRWRGWVARVTLAGQLDTGFGYNGWLYSDAADTIADAALGSNRAYFLGNTQFGMPTTRVMCVDFGTHDSCYSPLAGLQLWNTTSTGSNTAAYAQRLIYDSRYGLFVAARIMNTSFGQLAGVARVNPSNGSLVTSFGNGGYYTGMSLTGHLSANVLSLNDMALPRQGTPGGTRLYVAGQGKRGNGSHNAFTFALDPDTGLLATNWGWYWYWWEGSYTGRTTAISALTVLSDGRLAFAGWLDSGDPNYQPMYLGVVRPDGSNDPGFCPGGTVSMCLVDTNANGGSGATAWEYKPYSTPVALAQTRAGDLIVADRFRDYGFAAVAPISNVHQRVRQYTGTGFPQVKDSRALDLGASASTTRWSRPFGLWVGGTGLWNYTGGTGYGEEVVAMIGTRRWTNADFDATVLHLRLQEALLSDGFEGP